MSDNEDGDEEMKCLLDGLEEYCAEEVTKVTVEVKEAHGEIKQLKSGLTKACDDVKTVDGKVCFLETAQEQRNVRTEEQLANFMTDIKVMKDGMVKVEQRLDKIESNIEKTCKDFIAKTFTAAATAARGQKLTESSLPPHIVSTATTGRIDPAVDCSTAHGDTDIIDADVSLPRIQPIAEFQPTLMTYADNLWSRKTSTPNTSQIYTDIDELPDEERKELSPFHDRNPMAAADYLSDLQRAFVKHYIATNRSSAATDSCATQLIAEGVRRCIWPRGWSPADVTNFGSYLKTRIKNEKQKQKRKADEEGDETLKRLRAVKAKQRERLSATAEKLKSSA